MAVADAVRLEVGVGVQVGVHVQVADGVGLWLVVRVKDGVRVPVTVSLRVGVAEGVPLGEGLACPTAYTFPSLLPSITVPSLSTATDVHISSVPTVKLHSSAPVCSLKAISVPAVFDTRTIIGRLM